HRLHPDTRSSRTGSRLSLRLRVGASLVRSALAESRVWFGFESIDLFGGWTGAFWWTIRLLRLVVCSHLWSDGWMDRIGRRDVVLRVSVPGCLLADAL